MNPFPHVDLFSFIFGFILAFLIILAFSQVRKLGAKLKDISQKQAEQKILNKKSAVESELRILLLRKYQRLHLASSLFPLNEIYVELQLQSAIIITDPHQSYEDEPAIFRHHLRFDDFPELISGKPFPLITLAEALSGGRNIAIMNEIGSGKTTLLAHFASEILEKTCPQPQFNTFLPVYVHINEIDYSHSDNSFFFSEITKTLCFQNPLIDSRLVNEILLDHLSNNTLIFLIDGLDELRPEQFEQAVKFVNSVLSLNKSLSIVLGIGPSYSAGLYQSGFSFLSLQFPDNQFRKTLLEKWKVEIEQSNQVSNLKNNLPEGTISSLWTLQESKNLLPYDLTLEIWNYLSPAYTTSSENNSISMISRRFGDHISIQTLENIAVLIARNDFNGIQSTQLSRFLKEQHKESTTDIESKITPSSSTSTSIIPGSTLGIELDYIIKTNLICINKSGVLSFSNPSILINLLVHSKRMLLKTDWKYLLRSPMDALTCKLSDTNLEIASNWLSFEDPILYRNILFAIRHILRNGIEANKFQVLFRKIFSLIQNEEIPLSIRIKLFSAVQLTESSTLRHIYKILKDAPSISMHQLAAFYFENFQEKESINTLIDFLNENNQSLDILCCFSLFSMWNKQCIEIFREILTRGSDFQRKITAELLAFKIPDGHALLEEYSQNEDILCRKAIIGGLRLVHEKWANSLIEKMTNEDNQWYVRDTALHALQNPHSNDMYIPRKLQDPWNASWLIKYASEAGLGLPEDIYPYDLLYRLLKTGPIEEQLCALTYLAEKPDKRSTQTLINLIKTDHPLREEALSILTQFSQMDSDLH